MQKSMEISGDTNPLHLDEEYAQSRGYPGRVVYGILTTNMISRWGGHLPSRCCLLWGVDVRFVSPVFIGDVLDIHGRIAEVNEEQRYIRVKVRIRNPKGQTVLRGSYMGGVSDEA